MVDSTESRRQTEMGQDSHITIIQSTQNIVSNFELSRLSAVAWTVSRLGMEEQVMGVQVGKELPQNYLLNDCGQEWKV